MFADLAQLGHRAGVDPFAGQPRAARPPRASVDPGNRSPAGRRAPALSRVALESPLHSPSNIDQTRLLSPPRSSPSRWPSNSGRATDHVVRSLTVRTVGGGHLAGYKSASMSVTISELVYNAIEVSPAEAAYHAFEEAQRGGVGRTMMEMDDPLDAARERLGGPSKHAEAFFNDLSTADLQLLTVLYYSARDWRGNNDGDESTLDPEREVRRTLRVTRKGSEEKTRELCLRKLDEVSGSMRLAMLLEGLMRFGDVASRLRGEFSSYENA